MNTKDAKIVAILLCGGQGLRFGSPFPKQFHRLSGKPIYLHTLEKFLALEIFEQIILPVPANRVQEVSAEIACYSNKVKVIAGGSSRQSSSYKALLAAPLHTEYVLIHDAVRPFVSADIIERNIRSVFIHKAVDTCIPSADTLVHGKKEEWIDHIPDRSELFRGQTPQTFAFPLLLKAHEKALLDGIENAFDDCSLMLRAGFPVKIVEGEEINFKITTEFDLFLAEQTLCRPKLENIVAKTAGLEGKIFAVTGATGGIGKALCDKLLTLGATPIEISTTSDLKADLTQYQEAEKVFAFIEKKYGAIDGLINSIGTFQVKDFHLLSPEEIEKTIHSNLTSVIYCCKYANIKEGGHIVNIASSSYSKGRKDYLVYSASKAAVVNFTQGLAEARQTLYINAIVPQRTNTELRNQQFPLEEKASLLEPEEVAEKICALLDSQQTGTILEIKKKYQPSSLRQAVEYKYPCPELAASLGLQLESST